MSDLAIEKLIREEGKRQKDVANLIASENYVSTDVSRALASSFGNKYAEGYPGKRYYEGNRVADKLEILCRNRALKLFKLSPDEWDVNLQPYSGSPANLAVYLALTKPGEKIMGMKLSHGGHLTHGHNVSATGMLWRQVSYGVSEKTEILDYASLSSLAKKEKPKMIITGYTAYPRTIDFKKFREIADSSGAYLMADVSHVAGLIAGGVYPSPFPFADVVTMTTHKTLRGPRGAMIFSRKSLSSKIDRAIFPGLQGGPHLNTIAAIAVALKEASSGSFIRYAKQVVKNAQVLADELTRLGWRVISGGTDSHLLLVDVWMDGRGIGGKKAAELLAKNNIITNCNTIPFDSRTPLDPSGLRLGTAAETTRGRTEADMRRIAKKIDSVLKNSLSHAR